MAAEDSNEVKKQELEDATSCCICTDVYTDPKLLPCTHTFCMKCLRETGLKTNKGAGDEMPCPICRRQFKIPPEGFHELPDNFFIAKLIQVENILDQSVLSEDVCDACLEENEGETSEDIPVADNYCIECRQKLCDECCRHHRKAKLSKNHQLVPIKELGLHKNSQSVMSNIVPSVCEFHEQKVLDVYCVKCNAVVCAICFIDDHKNHEGSHVSKFVNGFRQQIEIHLKSMHEYSSEAQRMKLELMKMKSDMQQKVESLESDVLNRKDEIKQLTDAHAQSILQSMGVSQRNKLKEIKVAAGEVDAYLSIIDSFKANCQKVMAQGTPSHICRSISNLSARAAALQQQCQSLLEQEIEPFACRICFKKSELEEFLQKEGGNLIGEIGEESDTKSMGSSTIIREQEDDAEKLMQDLYSEKMKNKALHIEVEKLRQELDNERKSSKFCQTHLETLQKKTVNEKDSVNQLEKTITALQSWMSKLELKKPQKLEREQLIAKTQEEKKRIENLRYNSDPVLVERVGTSAATEQNKDIRGLAILDKEFFIVSHESSEVEVFDRMKLSFSRRWISKELIHPEDIASCSRNKCLYIMDFKVTEWPKEILRVDPSGKLINKWSTGDDHGFAICVTDETNVILTVHDKNKLNEYSSNGQLIREIYLSMAGIRYPLCAKKLVNGHFLVSHGRDGDKLHGVCVVDAEARLKKSFGGEPGSTAGNIWDPVDLAIDGKGFVLVADHKNCRVLLLDSDLRFKREILSMKRHGLRDLWGIFLDELNYRLFIIDKKLIPKNKCGPISIFDF